MQIVNLLKIAILKQMFVIQSIRTLGEYFLQYFLVETLVKVYELSVR